MSHEIRNEYGIPALSHVDEEELEFESMEPSDDELEAIEQEFDVAAELEAILAAEGDDFNELYNYL